MKKEREKGTLKARERERCRKKTLILRITEMMNKCLFIRAAQVLKFLYDMT